MRTLLLQVQAALSEGSLWRTCSSLNQEAEILCWRTFSSELALPKTGRGIDRIFEGAALYGRPWPDYSESNDGFVRVRVMRAEADMVFYQRVLSYKKRFARNPSTLALLIMSSLEDSPGLDKAELCRRTGFTQTRVAGQIETLLREGVIELVGDGYRLVNTTGLSSNSLPEDAGSEASIDDPTAVILRLVSEKQVIRRDDVVKALSVTPQKLIDFSKR